MLNAQSGRQVLIPTQALGEQMGEYYVFVVEDGTAHRRKVITGDRINGRAVIREGLEGGTTVVTEGLKNVQDSSGVKLLPARNPETAPRTRGSADTTAS